MNKLFRLIISLALIFQPLLNDVGAVTINYPTTLDDNTSLYDVKNNQTTNLDEVLDATETAITVDSTSGFPTNGTIQIDNEVIYYSSKNSTTFVGCTRGYDGTSNTTHLDNTEVNHSIISDHINIKRDAIIAIETELGLLPKGSHASVRARLDYVDTSLSTTLTQNEVITLSGDVTGSGRTSIATIVGVTHTAISDFDGAVTALMQAESFGGDVTGTIGVTAVGDDSHAHTASTVSGLSPTDFTTTIISQWYNDSDYQTTAGTVTNFSGSLAGDVTGTQGITVVGDDSHAHTASTVSGLSPTDFTTTIVSQWYNDAGYITNDTDITEADLNFTDTTLADSSTTEHGLCPKLDNTATHYLDGTGNWSEPSGSGDIVLVGDVTGTFDSNTVEALQGIDVSATAPTNSQVLKYNSGTSKWEPAADSSSSGGIATIQEVDVTVTDNASVLNFQEGFDVTETPAGTVEVALDLTEKQVNLTTEVTGILPTANGGTGLDAATTGDIIIATGTDTWDQLAAGTAGYVLTSNGANTVPSYQAAASGGTIDGARCYNNADVALTTAVARAIPLNTEEYDTGSYHSTVTNNTRMTITNTGTYMLYANGSWASNSSGYRQMYFLVDNTTIVGVNLMVPYGSGATQQQVFCIVSLNAGQYVEWFCVQNSGGSLDVDYGAAFTPYFVIERLR